MNLRLLCIINKLGTINSADHMLSKLTTKSN